MSSAFAGYADERVDVGLDGKLDGERADCTGATVNDERSYGGSWKPRKWEGKVLVKGKGGGHSGERDGRRFC